MPKREVTPGLDDLASVRPDLAKEWHPTKNSPKTPKNTYSKSESRVVWLCSKNTNHEWEAILSSRVRGAGCPFCSNKKVLSGDNDLATTHPNIAKLWDFEKNTGVTPDKINSGSNKVFWWVCDIDQNHKWKAPPARLKSGTGCPSCSGRVAIKGESDLETTHPELALQWDYSKNGSLTPSLVKSGTNKSVWWLCSLDKKHSWKAVVASRALAGRGCPYCSNHSLFVGQNDLGTMHPDISKTWSKRNHPLLPQDVIAGSRKKVWWSCEEGHEYEMPLYRRVSGSNCSICAGKAVVSGVNDLAFLAPDLAKEWDFEANHPLLPSTLTLGSNKSVWWQCQVDRNHKWESSPNDRKTNGCPVCSGHKVIQGINDFATISPDLAKEFAQDLNPSVSTSSLSNGSNTSFWWRCSKDPTHEWNTSISNRTRRGDGCPICSNSKLLSGFNDLETKYPELAMEWHSEKNESKDPSKVLFGSDLQVWWKCSVDPRHEWKTKVSSRTYRDAGCPVCSNLVVMPGVNDLSTVAPELAKFWHPTKNKPLLPSEIGAGTHKSVWWFCNQYPEHEWKTPVVSRYKGTQCPFCSNQKVFSGFNDLETINPSIARDWHQTKNAGFHPSSIAPNSNKKFWWTCFNDPSHEWQASPASRSNGTNCPTCANSGYDTSRRGLFYYIEHQTLGASKIGITNPERNSDRLSRWQKFGWRVIYSYESESGLMILNLETNILRWIRKDLGFMPFLSPADTAPLGGWSETFSSEAVSQQILRQRIDREIEDLRMTNTGDSPESLSE